MAKCKNCKYSKDVYEIKGGKENKYNWCRMTNDNTDLERERTCVYYEAITNGQKVRKMTDEELAMNMMCPNESGIGEIKCNRDDKCNCYECLLVWLKSEVGCE